VALQPTEKRHGQGRSWRSLRSSIDRPPQTAHVLHSWSFITEHVTCCMDHWLWAGVQNIACWTKSIALVMCIEERSVPGKNVLQCCRLCEAQLGAGAVWREGVLCCIAVCMEHCLEGTCLNITVCVKHQKPRNVLVGFHAAPSAWIMCGSGVASGLRRKALKKDHFSSSLRTFHTLRSHMHTCMHTHHTWLTTALFHCAAVVCRSPLVFCLVGFSIAAAAAAAAGDTLVSPSTGVWLVGFSSDVSPVHFCHCAAKAKHSEHTPA